MKLSLSFVFAALVLALDARTVPITAPVGEARSEQGMIHLPLKRLHNLERRDVHPQIVRDSVRDCVLSIYSGSLSFSSCINSTSTG